MGAGIVASMVVALLLLAAGLAYADVTYDLPNVQYLPILLNPPDGLLLQPTRVYDRSGKHLLLTFAPSDGPRRYIPLNPEAPQHLPDSLAKATVAVADSGFWSHNGYSLSGLNDPAAHPTLAQKLVSDLLLYDEAPSLRRELRERILAAQATIEYGRSQILEWVLNSEDYGNEAFGAEAAAQFYFGKPATGLSLAESAWLAEAAQAQYANSGGAQGLAPQSGEKAIEAMLNQGAISTEQAIAALAAAPELRPPSTADDVPAPAFVHLVRTQLDQQFARERIERGGVVVTTTLDYDLQQQARCATVAFVLRLEATAPPSSTPCPAADKLPALPPDTAIPEPSASALVLDPQSGEVLAAVGEIVGAAETQTLAAHDAGTLMNPFIYLTAFARGFGPASMVWDIPAPDEQPSPGAQYHGPVRMRIALVNDYRVPTLALAAQMGTEAIDRTETSFGLRPGGTTLLEMTGAYGILATQGLRYGQPGPFTVLRVEGLDHSQWLDLTSPQEQPVLAAPLAYLMNAVLSDETAREPLLGNPNPLDLDRPAGAKIGQTDSGMDAWTVGYTPARVVGVWVGTDQAETALGRSPRIAASLWNALMQVATDSEPASGWSPPEGVTKVDVCDPSGMLPTKDCPSIVGEVFLTGSEPTQTDTLYRSLAVNRETGYLATVYTPPQLVENRVYMVLPPQAQAWAKWANVPVAPAAYDAIQAEPINPDVRITSPTLFAQIRGSVQIQGTASGADFKSYRVLVGQGINPQDWIAVGDESTRPVEAGVLATWDATGLSGLYAVQLQVVRSDQRIDTSITQVTVQGN